MSLKKLLMEGDAPNKIITPRHREWLQHHGDEPYPQWVVRRISRQLLTPPRDRRRSFSASAAGSCLRAQELAFCGAEPTFGRGAPTPDEYGIFRDGKWRHLKWQADLLTQSMLEEIEVPARAPKLMAEGSMDGVGHVWWDHPNLSLRDKRFVFEGKGVNPVQYAQWVKATYPIEKHMHQIHRYMNIAGLDLAVVLYENKWNNQFHEWVVRKDHAYSMEQWREIGELAGAATAKELHDPLPTCKLARGDQFEKCPFGGRGGTCLKTKKWPGA